MYPRGSFPTGGNIPLGSVPKRDKLRKYPAPLRLFHLMHAKGRISALLKPSVDERCLLLNREVVFSRSSISSYRLSVSSRHRVLRVVLHSGREQNADRGEDSRRKWEREDVVVGGPHDVLLYLLVALQ